MKENVQKANRLASIILQWHLLYGREQVHKLPPEIAQQYLARVSYYKVRQQEQKEYVHELVEEQIKGIFEYFYSQKIPASLLNLQAQDVSHESLGELALFIRQLLKEDMENLLQETSSRFHLSQEWLIEPITLHPSFILLHQKNGETARQTLRAYFQPLAELENVGIGGRELMVAMNEDLLDQEGRSREAGFIPTYHPASFDFQLATGENSLISQVLQGNIDIIEVILGSDTSRRNS